MRLKAEILDEGAVKRALKRIAHEIIERNDGINNVCLVGIRRRGVPLAKILADNIEAAEGKRLPVGILDITLYRDDLEHLNIDATVNATDIDFDLKGKHVVMVDDVLYTGRTARAAMEAILKLGRPEQIQFAALIDRGHRQMPIRADYVGKNIPTSKNELIAVNVEDLDGKTCVELYEK